MTTTLNTREDVIAAVEAASLCCPEHVADVIIDALETSGPEAAAAELAKAIANNPAEERRLGIAR